MNQFFSKKCIAYYRVSTDDQAERYSLSVQQQLMETWAERNQAILDTHFVDDHSAKDFRRPGFNRLMSYLGENPSKIKYVLIIDWSRFSRNITESYVKINELKQLGVEVQAIEQIVDDSIPESTIMKAIFLAAPEAENRRRSINVVKGMRAALLAGNWCGGKPPRGYHRERNTMELIINDEGKLIGQAFEKIANESYTISDARDFAKIRGLDVSFKTFSKILRNPFYSGSICHKLLEGQIVKGRHQSVVNVSTWSRVQEILNGNKKSGRSREKFPLKRFLKCPNCEKSFTGYQVKKKQKPDGTYRVKKSQPIYYKCSCATISGGVIHRLIVKILNQCSIRSVNAVEFSQELRQILDQKIIRVDSDISVIKSEITKKSNFLDKLEKKFIDGVLDQQMYLRHREETTDTILRLRRKLINLQKNSAPDPIKLVAENKIGIGDYWQELDVFGKRKLQEVIFPEGLFFDKRTGKFTFSMIDSRARMNSKNCL